VFVIDESADALQHARENCSAPNVFFLIGTPNVLPLPDGSIDVLLGDAAADERERVVRRS
jgi:ubiquinone/menaquinone biosynthesis C-methylase UbiE